MSDTPKLPYTPEASHHRSRIMYPSMSEAERGGQCKHPWVGREAIWYCVLERGHDGDHGYDRVSGRGVDLHSFYARNTETRIRREIEEDFADA